MKKCMYLFIVLFFLSTGIFPVTPSSGLPGIAVSTNGKWVAVGGISRVIYVMDSTDLKTMKRIPVKTQVLNIAFSNDDTMLISENRDESLNFIDLKQGKVVRQFRNSFGLTVSKGTNELAVISKQRGKYSIHFHSLADGALLREIPIPYRAQLMGIDPDFKRLVVLCKGAKNIEKKLGSSGIPKDLKGLKRSEFIQKNDGKVSVVLEFDPRSGKQLNKWEIFFSVSQYARLLVLKNTSFIITYGNVNAEISATGEVALFRDGKHYNYGIGFSPETGILAAGGLRRGMIKKVPKGTPSFFTIPSIPGWPEYFKGFAFSSTGSVYASTSAFRLIKLDPAGKMVKAVSVY